MSLVETPQLSTDPFVQAEAAIKARKAEAASIATVRPPTPEEALADIIRADTALKVAAMQSNLM